MFVGFHPDMFGQDHIFYGVSGSGEIHKIHGQWYLWDESGKIWAASSPQNDYIDQPSQISDVQIIDGTIKECEGKFFGS